MTNPVTGAAPVSPSVQWIVSSEDVLVMDISIGEPGEPSVTDTQREHVLYLNGHTAGNTFKYKRKVPHIKFDQLAGVGYKTLH